MQPRRQQRLLVDTAATDKVRRHIAALKTLCTNYLNRLSGYYGYRELSSVIHAEFESITASTEKDKRLLEGLHELANQGTPNGASPDHFLTFRHHGIFNAIKIHYQHLFQFNSPHLNKLAKVSEIYDRFSRLEEAFTYADFDIVLTDCETYINSAEIEVIVAIPRDNAILPFQVAAGETEGSKLLKNLNIKLRALREDYSDLYVPDNVETAKKLYISKVKFKTDIYKSYLDQPANTHPARKKVVAEINACLANIEENRGVLDSQLIQIEELIIKPINRTVFKSHKSGVFVKALGTPNSDDYLRYLDKQLDILKKRIHIFNPDAPYLKRSVPVVVAPKPARPENLLNQYGLY